MKETFSFIGLNKAKSNKKTTTISNKETKRKKKTSFWLPKDITFKLTYHIVWRQMHLLLIDSLSTGNFFVSLQSTVCPIRITCETKITLLLTEQ